MSVQWQPKEIEILKQLIEKGYEAEDISKVLINRNPSAISAYCYSHKIQIGKATKCIDEEEFKKLMKGK